MAETLENPEQAIGKVRPGTMTKPGAKPRTRGPVYLSVPRELAALLIDRGEPAEASMSAPKRDDAMMAMAKLAAMGIASDFRWSDETGGWCSGIQIPGAVFDGFVGECDLVKSISLGPGNITVDKYLTKF